MCLHLTFYNQWWDKKNPETYCDLKWLQKDIDRGLDVFLKKRLPKQLEMRFRFEAFPKEFVWPQKVTDADSVRRALKERRPIYQA